MRKYLLAICALILILLPIRFSAGTRQGTGGFALSAASAQENSKALDAAKMYIQVKPFSRDGLIYILRRRDSAMMKPPRQ